MQTTLDYISDLKTQKDNLIEKLQSVGVTASNAEKFNTIIPKIQELEDLQQDLSDNLNAKGAETSEDEKFSSLIPKVLSIPTGNKVYSTYLKLTSVETSHSFTLNFEPKFLYLSACKKASIISDFIPTGDYQYGIYEYQYIDANAFGKENDQLKKNVWVKPDETIGNEVSPTEYYIHNIVDNGDGNWTVTIGGDLDIPGGKTYHYNLIGGTSSTTKFIPYLFVAMG